MTRDQYERDICAQSGDASAVIVKHDDGFDGWVPTEGHCHENVEHWVKHHDGHTAVRGWIYLMGGEPGPVVYTAHSVVRGPDGKLFDITPLYNKEDKSRGRFILHVGDDPTFRAMKKDAFIFLTCQGNLPAVPLAPMLTLLQDYTLPSEDGL